MTSVQSNSRLYPTSPVITPKTNEAVKPTTGTPEISPEPNSGTEQPEDQVQLKGEQPPETSQTQLPETPEPELSLIQRLDQTAAGTGKKTGLVRLERQALQEQLHDTVQQFSADGVQRANTLHLEHRDLASRILSSQTDPIKGLSSSDLQALTRDFASSDQTPKTFASLEAAIEAANQNNQGLELIVEMAGENGDKQYALIELKSKPELETLKLRLEPSNTQAYLTDGNGVVSVLAPAHESAQARFERVQELYQVAQADTARGFDLNRTGTQQADRTPAYKANLLTVQAELVQTTQALKAEKADLESELKSLRTQGLGDSSKAQATVQRLQHIGGQLLEVHTAKTIIEARLTQLPKSETSIPGSELKAGADRSHPERIQQRLQKSVDLLESQLLVTQNPAERKKIDVQKKALYQEMEGVSLRALRIQSAELSYQVRIGSLATINNSLDQAQTALKKDLTQLQELEHKLPSLQGQDLAKVQAQIETLKSKIQKGRETLIDVMKAEISSFKQHANMRQEGPQKVVELLNLEVAKLDALGTDDSPEVFLAALEETQRVLLEDISSAAAQFVGIRPSEARAMGEISEKTDQYIADYKVADKKLQSLQVDLSRKEGIWKNPPISSVGQQQLSAIEKAYLAKIQGKLKDAPEGSELEHLKNLYIALEMSKDPELDADLRARIDVDEIQNKIAELSKSETVQKAFQDARNEAIQEVFGSHDAVNELATHILSADFQEYLSMLPEDQQRDVLKAELEKLTFLNPAKAQEVQKNLLGRQLQSQSGTILKNTSLEERKEAFAKIFDAVNDPNTTGDKSAKAADGLAQIFEALSPAEMAKMQEYLSLMGKDPTASQKLFQLLSSKLSNAGPSGTAALEKLGKIHASGKLGAFMTLAAAVATTGKLPDAIAKGDFKSVADLASSAMSVAGGAAGLFDTEKMLLAAKNLHLDAGLKEITAAGRLASAGKFLKVVEVLGPIGDIAGAGLDAYGSYKDFEAGDTVGGYSKAVGAGAGATGAVAGVFILAGSTGPGAPFVLAGATIIGLAAWGFDSAFGESDEETFLRQQGVLKPQPAPPVRPHHQNMFDAGKI